MNMNMILYEIRQLSFSQGFYGRLYNTLIELQNNDPEKYEKIKTELEAQNFKDAVDMVLYFEN